MPFAFHYNPGQQAPFAIYIAHEDKTRGTWKPAALITVTPALRTSGFLGAIRPDEFKSLLLLLSFLSPDGRCAASVTQLAQALRQSQAKTRARFRRLADVRWQGQPIVLCSRSNGGLDGFAPAPGFIPVIEEPQEQHSSQVLAVLPREAVIAHSRRTYARTRAEVEREIEEMMNWRKKELPPKASLQKERTQPAAPARSSAQQQLRDELLAVGLFSEQADELITRYDPVRIRRQLAWLPLRGAKNKAGYLLAAIKDDYAAPRSHTPDHQGERGG